MFCQQGPFGGISAGSWDKAGRVWQDADVEQRSRVLCLPLDSVKGSAQMVISIVHRHEAVASDVKLVAGDMADLAEPSALSDSFDVTADVARPPQTARRSGSHCSLLDDVPIMRRLGVH